MYIASTGGNVNIDNYRKYRHWYRSLLLSYPFRLKDPVPQKVRMAGDCCLIEPGQSHGMINNSDKDLAFMALVHYA